MDVQIREASEADASFIAWVQMEAARSHRPLGFWDVAFPGPDAPRLEWMARIARSRKRSFAHVSGFLVAELDGAPVAALSGYDPSETLAEHFVAALVEELGAEGWSPAHLELLYTRFAPFLACMVEDEPGAWVVEWVAALPRVRRSGIVSRLLEQILERGRERGHRCAQLNCMIGNLPALRCYERQGFAVADEKRHPDFEALIGAPGTARMRIDL